ncbi:hypothetical protein [Sphingomonas sp.]|uniref:hypothetical protein n=1 Tax=Sphingomonas sp. TaxID=28214 RepID=UPI003AFF901F
MLAVALATSGAAAAPSQPRIAGFKAFLFNSETGTLSKDMMPNQSELGNVVAGDLASVSTFVVVTVSFGPQAAIPDRPRVRLLARTEGRRGRLLLDRTSRVGPVARDGTTHVGFWLDDTGCETIDLQATLIGATAPARVNETLSFHCYE